MQIYSVSLSRTTHSRCEFLHLLFCFFFWVRGNGRSSGRSVGRQVVWQKLKGGFELREKERGAGREQGESDRVAITLDTAMVGKGKPGKGGGGGTLDLPVFYSTCHCCRPSRT